MNGRHIELKPDKSQIKDYIELWIELSSWITIGSAIGISIVVAWNCWMGKKQFWYIQSLFIHGTGQFKFWKLFKLNQKNINKYHWKFPKWRIWCLWWFRWIFFSKYECCPLFMNWCCRILNLQILFLFFQLKPKYIAKVRERDKFRMGNSKFSSE